MFFCSITQYESNLLIKQIFGSGKVKNMFGKVRNTIYWIYCLLSFKIFYSDALKLHHAKIVSAIVSIILICYLLNHFFSYSLFLSFFFRRRRSSEDAFVIFFYYFETIIVNYITFIINKLYIRSGFNAI